MRVVVQRVARARVAVGEQIVGRIGRGLLLLVGIGRGDGPEQLRWMANKVVNLRIFEDKQGQMNRALLEVGGEILAVPQFTLYGDARKGRRPSFEAAAPPEVAEPLFGQFVEELRRSGLTVAQGVFQAHMLVELANDGPVTLILERE
ncbi:MAG: D-aminoacyl-tRNA deacylase [Candidatus Acetothermia bacterium]|jgi:D-tyrosyl-tRNA(Tyr) deacylase|nr:D-aminoacyl-tRNA deacylase [Candidatus Acetothermia bacterium]MDH7505733.1 D-aminoacyl-tRNA deacylase [Candidatus Acetothermia bacterium]